MKKIFITLIFCFFISNISISQFVKMPLIISDGSALGVDTLFFGIDPLATNGIDAGFGEQELPPPPPSGVFDIRFIDTHLRDSIEFAQGIIQGLEKDYRQGNSLTVTPRTHEVQFKKGSGNVIQFNFPFFPPHTFSLRFVDLFGGILLDTTFTAPGTLTSNYFNINDKVFIYANYQDLTPVELLSFSHSLSGNNVLLKWITSIEINNSGYEVQRKNNSEDQWQVLGFVESNSNSINVQEYTYSDNNLKTGTYSYRLKQIDFNGNFEYLNLYEFVFIGNPNSVQLFQNYPNPFNPNTKISFQLPATGNLELSIFDTKGMLIENILNGEFNEGYYNINFSAENLASGIYFYRLNFNGNSVSKKMIVSK